MNVADGSASACRARDLTAENLTSKLSNGIADGRGRQYPTQRRQWPLFGRKDRSNLETVVRALQLTPGTRIRLNACI